MGLDAVVGSANTETQRVDTTSAGVVRHRTKSKDIQALEGRNILQSAY